MRGQVFAHLLAHEHAVGADVDDAALGTQTGHQLLDLGINQRFATADGNHGRITVDGRLQAVLQGHHVLEAGGVLANATAAGAGEVAGVQRFQLQHHCESRRSGELMTDDVTGNLDRQGQRKSHDLN